MGLPKAKNMEGLGRTLMNDKFGGASRGSRGGGAKSRRKNGDGSERYTTTHKEADWVKMRSVTEQQALDEFLSTAELADTDFTAEKMNIKIIHSDQINPYLLSTDEEKKKISKHKANAGKLTVPRRPHWDENTTPAELERMEKDSFLDWRRGLAELAENNDLLLTPFERNLEVWRQLWRVIERSDLVVQIVDARNPLHFRSEDLENYVKEIDANKKNLLLVNKADMMTEKQRLQWAEYFEREGVDYKFFSAALAKENNEEGDSEDEYEDEEEVEGLPQGPEDLQDSSGEEEVPKDEVLKDEPVEDPEPSLVAAAQNLSVTEEDPRTRIITVDELEAIFLSHAPAIQPESSDSSESQSRKINVGLVGYPNVGKSSTINALIGAKKVSVSSTPGKTKHFQTIHLSPSVMLVDCPGLVFPNFATTKADLVCNGVLPIDQLREFTGPAGLVAQRIPKSYLEGLYGITINVRPPEEGGTGIPTASEMLMAYARARGFTKTGTGRNWDESRAARLILKDYVNGRLLFCHPPPADPEIDAREFNKELYDIERLPAKRREAILAAAASPSISELNEDGTLSATTLSLEDEMVPLNPSAEKGTKSKNLDKQFFKSMGAGGHIKTPYHYVAAGRTGSAGGSVGSKGLTGRKARLVAALEKGVDPADLKEGKMHFKTTRVKRRTNTVDD